MIFAFNEKQKIAYMGKTANMLGILFASNGMKNHNKVRYSVWKNYWAPKTSPT